MDVTLDCEDNNMRDRNESHSSEDNPTLTIDVMRSPTYGSDDFGSPTLFIDNDTEKPGSTSPRVMRSACDFCHAKRIKCRRDEMEPEGGRCQQCVRRNIPCKFSFKEKTGPKPKVVRNSKDSSHGSNHEKRKSPSANVNESNSSTYSRSISPPEVGVSHESPRMIHGHPNTMPVHIEIHADSRNDSEVPKIAIGQQPLTEQVYLRTYLSTVSKLLPFCEERSLIDALALRERAENPSLVPSSITQAQLAGSLAIGALIRNSQVAEEYHVAARAHLKALFSMPSPEAGSVLCMLAFYWQYKGDDEKKTVYLRHARLGLEREPGSLTLELRLCMEHLDYENSGRPKSITLPLSPCLRALHIVSCVLSDIQELMEPTAGFSPASVYCVQLHECSKVLDVSKGEGLPLLLCTSLHAFLLVMLGRGADAVYVLKRIPSLLEACPDAPRALPLSWDASLIAATLSFLLKLGPTYASIYAAVEPAQNSTSATQWTCQLPPLGGLPEEYLFHTCCSTSNICSIICQVGRQTNCGLHSFYAENHTPEPNISSALRSPLTIPQLPHELTQQIYSRQNQAVLHKQLQNSSLVGCNNLYPSTIQIPQPNQRRTRFEITGSNGHEDLTSEMHGAQLLNSNQASPVPYTPKRIRNSRCNTPVVGLSPTTSSQNESLAAIAVSQLHFSSTQPLLNNTSHAGNSTPPMSGSPCSVTGNYAFEYVPQSRSNGGQFLRDSTSLNPEILFPGFNQNMNVNNSNRDNAGFQHCFGMDEQNVGRKRCHIPPSENSNNGGNTRFSGTVASPGFLSTFPPIKSYDPQNSTENKNSGSEHIRQLSSSFLDVFSNRIGSNENLIGDVDGSGIFTTLGLSDTDNELLNESRFNAAARHSKQNSNDPDINVILKQDSAYLGLMDDNDLMGVLQDWSMVADNVDSDLIFSLNEPSGGRHTPVLQT